MKKRIGTKIYDTETSEVVSVSPLGTLYRKRTRAREWFLQNGETIVPMTDREARAMLGESAYREREPDTNSIMVRVDRDTHRIIADEAKRRGISMTEAIRALILR